MEYFHLGIFVTPRAYLIRKYGSQSQAFFSVVRRFFDTVFEKTILSDLAFKTIEYPDNKILLLAVALLHTETQV